MDSSPASMIMHCLGVKVLASPPPYGSRVHRVKLSCNKLTDAVEVEKKTNHDTRESIFMNEHNTTATEQLIKKPILAAPEQQSKQSDAKLQITLLSFYGLKK